MFFSLRKGLLKKRNKFFLSPRKKKSSDLLIFSQKEGQIGSHQGNKRLFSFFFQRKQHVFHSLRNGILDQPSGNKRTMLFSLGNGRDDFLSLFNKREALFFSKKKEIWNSFHRVKDYGCLLLLLFNKLLFLWKEGNNFLFRP